MIRVGSQARFKVSKYQRSFSQGESAAVRSELKCPLCMGHAYYAAHLSGSDGSSPFAAVSQETDGKLYGSTTPRRVPQ